MRYQEYLPHPSLRPYIANFWLMEVESCAGLPRIEQILPDGNASLMFSRNSIQRSCDRHPDWTDLSNRAVFVGQKSKSVQYSFPTDQPVLTWGVRFHSSGVGAFSSLPMHQCTDQLLDATCVFSNDVEEIMLKIMEETSPMVILSALNQFFLSKLISHQTPLLVTSYMTSALQRFPMPIQQLAGQFRMSTRQVERYFKTYVGLAPKTFACIARFNLAILEAADYPDISLYEISNASGYFNTIHMHRESLKICGQRPQIVFQAEQSQMRPIFQHIIRQRLAS
ncbi:MAG: helix-turn-helix domain-containing protein [Saprospiraceae bacterium]|nr:helix-turn-helix domain-containing protein [Saprospiraceae bacterium]